MNYRTIELAFEVELGDRELQPKTLIIISDHY
jgi:hypothetical protein